MNQATTSRLEALSRPEVDILLEIVPSLDRKVIAEILRGNNFDLAASIDAALALTVSLSEEEGSAVVNEPSRRHSAPSSELDPTAARSRSASNISDTVSPSRNRVEPVNNPQKASRNDSQPTSSKTSTPSSAVSPKQRPLSAPLFRSLSRRKSSNSSDVPASMKETNRRGSQTNLPPDFLQCPRFRFYINKEYAGSIDFSIVFRRKGERLGIFLQDVNGEVCVQNLVGCDGPNDPIGLAMEAGVMVGDMLIGINNEYFCPGVDLQDVIDIFYLELDKITLHFSRIRNSSFERFAPHHFASILLEQSVIRSDDIGCITKHLVYLMHRLLSWDSQTVMSRIQRWKLNVMATSPASIPSLMNTTVAFHSTSLPISSGAWKSPDVLSDISAVAKHTDMILPSSNLRPSLSIRIMKAEECRDHVVYVIWVMDVMSGAEWVIQRRFREFAEFRDLLTSIRPVISRLIFPPKRINVAEASAMISERQILLQKFLRRVAGIAVTNSLHPSSIRIQLALQEFLGVEKRIGTIEILERQPVQFNRNLVQSFVHSVLLMSAMDKVLNGFIDNFMDGWETDMEREWTTVEALELVSSMREFIDRLQGVLCDGILDDCFQIIQENREKQLQSSSSGAGIGDNLASASQKMENRLAIVSNMRERLYGFMEEDKSLSHMSAEIPLDMPNIIDQEQQVDGCDRDDEEVKEELRSKINSGDMDSSGDNSRQYQREESLEDKLGPLLSISREDNTVAPYEINRLSSLEGEESALVASFPCIRKYPKGSEHELTTFSTEYISNVEDPIVDGKFYKIYSGHRRQIHEEETVESTTTKDKNPQHNDQQEVTSKMLEEDQMRITCKEAIRRQVEIEIYIACAIRLRGVLESTFRDAEYELQLQMETFKSKPQSYYGIPLEQISPSGWNDVVFALQSIRKHTLPIDRLKCLAEVAKMIPSVFRAENPNAQKPLGADEFLPIFIYVVVQAQVPNILCLNFELQHLCDKENRLSECGYYLATFEAALQHIGEGTFTPHDALESRLHYRLPAMHTFDNDNDDASDDSYSTEAELFKSPQHQRQVAVDRETMEFNRSLLLDRPSGLDDSYGFDVSMDMSTSNHADAHATGSGGVSENRVCDRHVKDDDDDDSDEEKSNEFVNQKNGHQHTVLSQVCEFQDMDII